MMISKVFTISNEITIMSSNLKVFGSCTVSQELTQPTPGILHVFTTGIFLCQPYTPEYVFIFIPSINSLVGSDYLYLLNFSNIAHHCDREA